MRAGTLRKNAKKAPFEAPPSEDSAPVAATLRGGEVPWLVVRGAAQNNLRNVTAAFPLGRFTCVTGVSGSGKSSLVNEILMPALARDLNGATTLIPGAHERVEVVTTEGKAFALTDPYAQRVLLDKVIAIDQTPIGRTPRSNPATYIKVFDEIRTLFTRLPDAKLRGYKPGRFSFNVPSHRGGGRCEACEGNGSTKLEMDFLADVWVECTVCQGRRFTKETRQITFKGRSIADVLDMDVAAAIEHFDSQPRILQMLQSLDSVGLDYLKLGQASTTLSGGEAQRIKLARELVRKSTGRTVYVLDEPTTGLHFEDVRRLLAVLHGFVDAGNTVIVIEHNLDVIRTADWVIDLGPEGGAQGGQIIAAGTPEQIAERTESHTGVALRAALVPATIPSNRGRSAAGPADLDPVKIAARDAIVVRGARQHNLRDVSLDLPRDRMTVLTGLSGSGKSSFAVDTVFAEGYRRYVESLSAYARQFLGQLAKPRVDHVEGLSPAICIEQKSASRSPRSTVGTVTEIYDYMRVLWARLGTPYCPACGGLVGSQTADQIIDRIWSLPHGTPIQILAPLRLGDGETWTTVMGRLKRSGYARVRINGEIQATAQANTIDARRRNRVEVVVDRTIVRHATADTPGNRGRIAESVEHALTVGNGLAMAVIEEQHLADDAVEQQAAGDDKSQPRGGPRELMFSQRRACNSCGASYEELSPHHFSFNAPLGWCETCEGLGVQRGAPAAEIMHRPHRSILNGGLAGWNQIEPHSPLGRALTLVCERLGVDVNTPLLQWTAAQKNALLFGFAGAQRSDESWLDGSTLFSAAPAAPRRSKQPAATLRFQWCGLFPAIDAAMRHNWTLRQKLAGMVADVPCLACRGGRLRPDAASVRLELASGGAENATSVRGPTLPEVCEWTLERVLAHFDALTLDERERRIAGDLVHELRQRLRFLVDVGLEYLTLARRGPTLSGGEAQRIRLASQIGSGLSGVLYVLDEPTIGLHPRDTGRLVRALHRLRDLGNTLVLVEHDREVIRAADQLVDFGPGAGALGGQVVAKGAPDALTELPCGNGTGVTASAEPRSLTQGYLSGQRAIPVPTNRRETEWQAAAVSGSGLIPATAAGGPVTPDHWLMVRGARQHNLKNIDVAIPLGRLVAVTGVSGSGKSSLVHDILRPVLARDLLHAAGAVGEHDAVELVNAPGVKKASQTRIQRVIDKVIDVDQSPIGATPVSNPATYTGVFDQVRELFARLPESKLRGYTAARFSFNRAGGRCEACEGYGQKCIEMHFLPDVWITCDACGGKRYTAETLAVKFKGHSIADVLELRVRDALTVFEGVPRVKRLLQMLADVGLDYVQLGQPAPTLSGGEAQRVKLAAELGKPDTGRTLYILDEPTTGLHFDDVRKLLDVLQRLVDLGNSVVVVEHNLDLIKCADWIIDLGPEPGEAGGRVVAAGTPENVAAQTAAASGVVSHTAAALAPVLAASPRVERAVLDAHALAEQQLDRASQGFGDVGRGVQMPWQVDGRRWHLEQRPTRDGGTVRWEAAALEFVIEQVELAGAGKLSAANWSERASVEVTAPGAETWFLHALTAGEWLLELYFRTPPGVFNPRTLERMLNLTKLDQRDDLPVYGSEPRVAIRPRRSGLDAIVIYVHDKAEIDTPGFRQFIKQAVGAYLSAVE